MSWSVTKFLKEFRASMGARIATVERKNRDYSGATDDPFANFRLIEVLTQGRISMEDGIIVRMSDKLARLATLTVTDPAVNEESFADTCGDLSAYAEILALARRSRTEYDDTVVDDTQCLVGPPAPMPTVSSLEQLKTFLASRFPGVAT